MKKISVKIFGHNTSISLEEEFFIQLKKIAEKENKSLNKIIEEIDASRGENNLSSAIRIFVLNYLLTL